jgi:hypothetical protein
MPWHCPQCDSDDGRPVSVKAQDGKVIVSSQCVNCGHTYTVERESLNLRALWPASPPDGGERT